MHKTTNKIAVSANISAYESVNAEKYIDGAPHLKFAPLRALYNSMAAEVLDFATQHKKIPKVLDLGAGGGSSTLWFLKRGAKVVAVDISNHQLETLRIKCKGFKSMLETRCEDIDDTLENKKQKYDIIVANSFLHHVPNYTETLRKVILNLRPYGQFFSFQDPLMYTTLKRRDRLFSRLAYLAWRVFKGDLIGGLRRHLRRSKGVYDDDSAHDNAEYHVIRKGVNQDAISRFFKKHNFDCTVVSYFSTQNRFFQSLGTALGLKNTFAIIAQKKGKE